MAKLHVNVSSRQIDWQEDDHFLFLNPKWPLDQFKVLKENAEQFVSSQSSSSDGFVILASSGTTQTTAAMQVSLKVIAKKSFLAAASSFNSFFSIQQCDVFLRALPLFHVGGLALHARSFLSGARIFEFADLQWSPQIFVNEIQDKKITRASLVPTQVYDLVQQRLEAPSCMDTVFVGGAQLNSSLRDQAVELGWPLLASYGMTETSSMVASQKYQDRREKNRPHLFQALPGVQFRTDSNQRLFVCAPGLMSAQLNVSLDPQSNMKTECIDFSENLELQTQDLAVWDGQFLEFVGRPQDLVKISGEQVSLEKLRQLWESSVTDLDFGLMNSCVLSVSEPRTENEIILVITSAFQQAQDHVLSFNQKVLPFERIKRVIVLDEIPRTDLGKIKMDWIRQQIQQGILK